MQNRKYYVYIITNKINTVLYTGITNNIERRIYEHKNKTIEGFSSRYNLNKLVYCEETNDIMSALEREKQIKSGSRKSKFDLISGTNPNWKDLS
jgi:putative endonuclease